MEKRQILRKIGIEAAIVILFIIVSYAYFLPLLGGKVLATHDIQSHVGMSKELVDYRNKTGDEAVWTNSMFGGMPGYLISVFYHSNLLNTVQGWFRILFHPAAMLILYLLAFYVLLSSMKVNRWLSVAGAFAFGFSSYLLIIISAGHFSKAYAIGYIILVIAGVIMAYRRNRWLGAILLAVGLTFEIAASHLQITYYGLLAIVIFGITELIFSVREKRIPEFLKTTGVLVIGALLAVMANFSSLYTTWEYSKETIRGKSDLTHNEANQTTGLDKDYVVQWSQGIDETLTLLIPNFKGGSHSTHPGIKSQSFEVLKERNVENPRQAVESVIMYYGDKPFTSGPYYAGAIVIFLFVLGLFVVKGVDKWWIVAATVVSLILSWGKYVMPLTSFLLDYLPLYNKFRAPEMTLVIAGFTIPMLAFLGLQKIFAGNVEPTEFKKGLYWSFGITAGISLVFALLPGIAGNFVAPFDKSYPDWLLEAVRADRMSLLRVDAFRSFAFIAMAAGALWFWHTRKLKTEIFFAMLALLILADLWLVDKRYLNNDNFVSKRESQNIYPVTPADSEILKDKNLSYRVATLENPWGEARTSYFHKSVGGYHAAKLRRYQELIDFNLNPELQKMVTNLQSQKPIDSVFTGLTALNMLNTKYIIYQLNNPPLVNPDALGNVWIVENYKLVANADEEIAALSGLNPSQTAVVDQRFAGLLDGKTIVKDLAATISLTEYEPNYLKYNYRAATDQLAVFSEIYYAHGWQAYVDGHETPHFRANYVLRAMVLPAGTHKVEFMFEPHSFILGNKVSLAGSLLVILLALGAVFSPLLFSKKKIT